MIFLRFCNLVQVLNSTAWTMFYYTANVGVFLVALVLSPQKVRTKLENRANKHSDSFHPSKFGIRQNFSIVLQKDRREGALPFLEIFFFRRISKTALANRFLSSFPSNIKTSENALLCCNSIGNFIALPQFVPPLDTGSGVLLPHTSLGRVQKGRYFQNIASEITIYAHMEHVYQI